MWTSLQYMITRKRYTDKRILKNNYNEQMIFEVVRLERRSFIHAELNLKFLGDRAHNFR